VGSRWSLWLLKRSIGAKANSRDFSTMKNYYWALGYTLGRLHCYYKILQVKVEHNLIVGFLHLRSSLRHLFSQSFFYENMEIWLTPMKRSATNPYFYFQKSYVCGITNEEHNKHVISQSLYMIKNIDLIAERREQEIYKILKLCV